MKFKKTIAQLFSSYKPIITTAGSFLLSFITESVLSQITEAFSSIPIYIKYLLLFVIWMLLLLLILWIWDAVKKKKTTFSETKKSIVSVSNLFRVLDTQTLFQYDERNDEIVTTAVEKKKKNILYYSLSAKRYLNWIDYVYFVYLRILCQRLQCHLIIGLHFPDEIKECKVEDEKANPLKARNDYHLICRQFIQYAEAILQNTDVEFYREDQFFEENKRKYAEDFRILYDCFALYYAKQIVAGGETYRSFKRRLSHLTSAFPIWMMAEKYKRARLYVLDNRKSFDVWDQPPLDMVRQKKDLYFIITNMIKYENGEKIDVHNEQNVINFTDSYDVIMRKFDKLKDSEYEVRLMIQLLLTDDKLPVELRNSVQTGKPEDLLRIIQAIQETYSFLRC